MGEGDDGVLFARHGLGGVEVDAAVGRQRQDVERVAGELPRDDVAVMLELADEDSLAVAIAEGSRDQVDRFGRAAGEYQLVRRAADEPRGGGARGLEPAGHFGRPLVYAAVHGGVVARVSGLDRVNHRLRLLRGRRAVEVMPPRPDCRELVADVEFLPVAERWGGGSRVSG